MEPKFLGSVYILQHRSVNVQSNYRRQSNRDYKPQGLVTMAMSESNAMRIADLLNSLYKGDQHAKVVPANQSLNIDSQYDLIGKTMPYEYWRLLTGADALPAHVAEYWYNTTVLKQQPLY